jgi:hypothetical protein
MAAIGSKDGLLKLAKLRTKLVEIDGATYGVREVSVNAFAEYGERMHDDRTAAIAALLVDCVLGDSGGPMLTQDEAMIVARNARVAMRLVDVILEISGLGADAKND